MLDKKHWTHHQEKLLHLIATPRFGIISDFDGTLSSFASEPGDAAITPANAQVLDDLAGNVTVIALVSGRGALDLRGRFERPWAVYYGNHGMEFWDNGQIHIAPQVQPWVKPLHGLLTEFGEPDIAGVIVENKGTTASVHYRKASDPSEVRERLYLRLQPLCEQYGFLLNEGQFIWEIKPPVALDKGTAAQAVVDDYKLNSVLFLGDDVTDVHAMQKLRELATDPGCELNALSIGVIHATSPRVIYENCDLIANGVQDIEDLLKWVNQNRASLSDHANE